MYTMRLQLQGFKALLVAIGVLVFLVVILVIAGSIFLIALPIILSLIIITVLVQKISPAKKKKSPQDYIEAEFKVKG